MIEHLLTMDGVISLVTLTCLEIILGVDNVIFISIIAAKLPANQRGKARHIGMVGALFTRIVLLSLMSWLASLTATLFRVADVDISGKSLILLSGGLFLLYKSTKEMHGKFEGEDDAYGPGAKVQANMAGIIAQIMLIDIVFSIDSVITAVGMSQNLFIMVLANVCALGIMLVAAKSIADFVEEHPTIKVLALSFLIMIGMVLVGEALSFHIPKGYVYFAMGFSLCVEMINIKTARPGKQPKPVHLRTSMPGPRGNTGPKSRRKSGR